MPWPDRGISWQRVDLFMDGSQQLLDGAPRKIGSSHRTDKESISCKDIVVSVKAYASNGMSWSVYHL